MEIDSHTWIKKNREEAERAIQEFEKESKNFDSKIKKLLAIL